MCDKMVDGTPAVSIDPVSLHVSVFRDVYRQLKNQDSWEQYGWLIEINTTNDVNMNRL